MSELSPEMQLLCACCRVKPRAEDIQLQAALATQINAEKLIAESIRQRVEPLLYHNLKQHAAGVFPEKVMQALAARVRRNAVNSLNSIRINLQLAQMLREHGIPFLPMKGVTLAQRYYGEVGLRHCNDIDFWIPEITLDTVRKLLAEQGCELDLKHNLLLLETYSEQYRYFLQARQHHEVFVHPSGVTLELHWNLTSNSRNLLFNPTNLIASGESIEIAQESLTMISKVPLLLYLCEHGGRHGWYRLKWLMDLPQVLERCEWDWPYVLAEAKRTNCFSSLLLGLKLAQILFDWKMPELVSVATRKYYLLNWQVGRVIKNINKTENAISKSTVTQKMLHKLFRFSLADTFDFLWNELCLLWFSKFYDFQHKLFIRLRQFKRGKA